MMNVTTTNSVQFDEWISRHHNALRKRIMVSCIFDDDVFHDTYLTMRESVAEAHGKDIESDFLKLYKIMFSRSFSAQAQYIHPDPLFFQYLRTEAVDFDIADNMADDIDRIEEQAKKIDRFCKANLDKEDYEIFKLRFIACLSIRELIAYTGRSSLTIQRKIKQIIEFIRAHFAMTCKMRIA